MFVEIQKPAEGLKCGFYEVVKNDYENEVLHLKETRTQATAQMTYKCLEDMISRNYADITTENRFSLPATKR